MAEAYENTTSVITDKDRKKISDAYLKERDTFKKEAKELLHRRTMINDEMDKLQKQADVINKEINWRLPIKPGEIEASLILETAAKVDIN